MSGRRGVLVGAVLLWGSTSASPCFATQPGTCTVISEVAPKSPAVATNEVLYDAPARLCLVEFLATAANGFAQVYDSATTTQTNANLAEPGAANATDHAVVNFGPEGYVTERGLGVFVHNGRVRVKWGR